MLNEPVVASPSYAQQCAAHCQCTVSEEQRFILARNVAEQGGLFSAIEFNKRNPDIYSFLFNEWSAARNVEKQ